MKWKFLIPLLLTIAAPLWAGEVIDGIAATVNGHPILQSDWEDEICFESLLAGRSLDSTTPDDRKAALGRLIDQELLREQMQAMEAPHASEQEVRQNLQEIRHQYSDAANEQGWRKILATFHLTEKQVAERLAMQLDVLRLVDNKLRPGVQIDAQTIESYYQSEFLPQLRHTGAKDVPLAEVTPKIKELLTQKKVNQLLSAWLQNLRSGSLIREEGTRYNLRGQVP